MLISCVEEILKADANQLHAQDSLYGGTPLHWSKTAEVRILWITAYATFGLYLCTKVKKIIALCQMCRLLLDNGCAVNYLSNTGESALHILTKKGRFEAAMVLLTHGANANLKGQDGNTALHLAMKVSA